MLLGPQHQWGARQPSSCAHMGLLLQTEGAEKNPAVFILFQLGFPRVCCTLHLLHMIGGVQSGANLTV